MQKRKILIIGEGHLSYRLKKYFLQESVEVLHITYASLNFSAASFSFLENIETYFKHNAVEEAEMVYLLEDKDENNLQLIIALITTYKNLPITASLFNENLIPHLSTASNLNIINPAKLAAPVFVSKVFEAKQAEIFQQNVNTDIIEKENWKPSLIQKLLIFYASFLLLAIIFFHFYEGLTWVNAAYFVVVTAASVGYGDISLAQSSSLSKIVDIILILVSTVFIWAIFSLVIDTFFKNRIKLALGRKKYTTKNHVIVCGLGRLGFFIVQQLLQQKEKVIIIEQSENANHLEYFRHLGVDVYIGDGKLAKVLSDVNISDAKAFISVVNNDALNLEIGLNVRTIDHTVPLILRIYDEQMALRINSFLKFHSTLSVSDIVEPEFIKMISVSK